MKILDFEFIVIGRGKSFSKKVLSKNLKKNVKFKYNALLEDLYEGLLF